MAPSTCIAAIHSDKPVPFDASIPADAQPSIRRPAILCTLRRNSRLRARRAPARSIECANTLACECVAIADKPIDQRVVECAAVIASSPALRCDRDAREIRVRGSHALRRARDGFTRMSHYLPARTGYA